MLHIVVAGLMINLEKRGLFEVFPEEVQKLWKKVQLRGLVVTSLCLQVALILSGKRRKHSGYIWFRLFVWSSYLLADWVATLSLGVIANNIPDASPETLTLWPLWVPFLLVHLGGPDTITAYSLEDNELWQRRTLELVSQGTVSLYIFLVAWSRISPLSILTIPMLIVGLIKFGERVAALRSASSEHFRNSLLAPPDPGPNYAKLMEEFTSKKADGYYVEADVIESSDPTNFPRGDIDYDLSMIPVVYKQFQRFKPIFVDLIILLSFKERSESRSFFDRLGSEQAFKVIEVELGLIYDAFYTKAPVLFSATGCVLRLVTVLLTSSVLILFPFTLKGHPYETVDVVITYLLLGGAIMLEIIGLLALLSSGWIYYWLTRHGRRGNDFLSRLIYRRKHAEKQWSANMAQYSLLDICLDHDDQRSTIIQKLLKINNSLEKQVYLKYCSVSDGLKSLIFKHFYEMSKLIKGNEMLMKICRSRGDYTLTSYNHEELRWSTSEVEFNQSILLWHIATELCYYCDRELFSSSESTASKHISDYMLYLLEMCPFMLPAGIGMLRFRDTCAELKEFFMNKNPFMSKAACCKMLLRVNTEVSPSRVKGDRCKSVLFDGCKLATCLRALDRDPEDPMARHPEHKWKMISRVWVEILGYAAINCRGAQHAQQLRKGGELLTHVWLLMAHLGITEQFQIPLGIARAKQLNAK